MKESLKEYFNFNKKERNATLILLAVIVLMYVGNKTMHLFVPEENYDYSEFQTEVDSFIASLTPKESDEYVSRLDQYIIDRYDTLELFSFNPNTTTAEEWLRLGLTEKQIGTITNYLVKGGKFYDKEDFQKMYGIRTKQYQILKPYIDLPEKSGYTKKSYKKNYKNYDDYQKEPAFSAGTLFEFNPNTATFDDWQKLGFSEKQSKTFTNYTSKGGKFYKKEDLLKIYGMKQEFYEVLEPYIVIENSRNNYEKKEENSNILIELNSATKEDLVKLKGIGDFYASRILKYRDLLGGFIKKEQLLEVYGFKPETYEKIKNNVEVNASTVEKIQINFADKKTLSAHPYIDYETAEKIANYRNKNGAYRSLETLTKQKILSQKTYDKILPYIKL